MKLCFIGEFPLPNVSPAAGPENVLYNLVKGIVEYNCTNHYNIKITILSIHNEIDKYFVNQCFGEVSVHYLPRIKFLPRSIGDPIIVRRALNRYNFDIVHAHYPIALAKIMDKGIPKVITLHGIFSKERIFTKNHLVRLLYHDYNTHMLKKILPKVDGFVAISPYIIDALKEMKLYHGISNVFQINNPIDSSFFEVVSNPTDNIIFYPAIIQELKNQIAAIHVAKEMKNSINNFKLILAGSYEKNYFKMIIDEISKENLSTVVEYNGVATRSEILELYRKSSIVYLLSKQEVQPMVLLEAMATGTPVIASNLKSIEYLVEDGVTGYLVNPDDHKKIAEYSIDLFKDEEKRSKMGQNAKRKAISKYHSDIIVRQTLDMYESILGAKN